MIHHGDALAVLRTLETGSVHCCVTSPPYFGLRDYGMDGQIGLEDTPDAYVARLVEVFREVRRVLRDDGTLWLNLGDSYSSRPNGSLGVSTSPHEIASHVESRRANALRKNSTPHGLKHKDLVGIPWRVAFALQANGWYLRQDIIWSKPNPMPESVTDRCTKSHEYIFLLSKSPRYYYDAEAVKEPVSGDPEARRNSWGTKNYAVPGQKPQKRLSRSGNKERKPGSARGCPESSPSNVCGSIPWEGATRNRRSVWSVATRPFRGAHFAVFPPEIVRPCILAGCPAGGTVLDPFTGSGTCWLVAAQLGRAFVGVELNLDYVRMARRRVMESAGLLASAPEALPLLAGGV